MDRKRFDENHYSEESYRFDEEANPQWYITCDVLQAGDYCNTGSLGEANIRALEGEGTITETQIGGRTLWLPDTPENRGIIEGLERNYPVVDDETVSEVEMEWEQEAWDDYGVSDLLREMRKPSEYGRRRGWKKRTAAANAIDLDMFTKEELWKFYSQAREEANAYPVFEGSGASLPLEQIADAYADLVEDRLLDDIVEALPKIDGVSLFTISKSEDWPICADWLTDNGHDGLSAFLRDLIEERE